MDKGDPIQDRYVLEESLGRGGMAEVWRAHDQRLDRSVAIKFLAPQLTADPEFLVRFFSEAQSVARISHGNVVSVLDFGEADGSPYLVMEHVPGGALADLTGEPLQAERAAEIVRDAALGAGAAHELGIIHRDIKPGNILLCEDGRATVADFGIAMSAYSEKLTATGQVIGSPHYISPEQAAGKGSRSESDVYALGVVLYELLTGRPPFDADNATAIAIAHVDEKPEAPSARGAEVDEALDALVLRCLAKDPAARYPNGTALAAALERAVPAIAGIAPVVADEPVTTVVDDTAPRPAVEAGADRGEGGRRGVLVAAGLIVFALLLGAGAWATLRDSRGSDSVASASESHERKKKPRSSPTSSYGYEDENGDWVETAPSPSPSDDDEGSEDRSVAGDDGRGDGGNDPGYYRDEQEPEEPAAEGSPTPDSSPTPQEEPTTEATPAPASSEAPEEGP